MSDKSPELNIFRWIDSVADEFERNLRAGLSLPLETFLDNCPANAYDHLLRVLLELDIYYRSQLAPVSPHDYLARFPGHRQTVLNAFGGIPVSEDPDSSGPRFDFEEITFIGRGAMGVVFKARQISLDRIVALKWLRQDLFEDQEALTRFRTEASLAARVSKHPHIVTIHQFGIRDGHPFLVMEFVEGHTLAALVKKHGPLDPTTAARYVMITAEAIAFAHDNGVLHRDLKPANIILDTTDEPLVMDFGLAKDLNDRTQLTASASIVGTPAYVAPEQLSGNASHSSDIYSLGAILYELLSARPPFKGTIDNVIHLTLSAKPRRVKWINAKVPRDLDAICAKCLEKPPQWRYASAAELAADLKRFLTGRPVAARPIARHVRTLYWSRRNPILALFCVLVVLATTVSAVLAIQVAIQTRAALSASATVTTLKEERQKLSDLQRSSEQRATVQEQRADFEAHVAKVNRLLTASRQQREPNPQRSLKLASEAVTLSLSRDGTVTTAAEQELRDALAFVGSMQPRGDRILHRGSHFVELSFSADGRWILGLAPSSLGDGYTAMLWNSPFGDAEPLVFNNVGRMAAAFTPDSKWLITGHLDGKIMLHHIGSGKHDGAPLIYEAHSNVFRIAVSPDGRKVLSGSGGGFTGFGPDGKTVLGTCRLWRIESTGLIPDRHLAGFMGFPITVCFSQDNQWLAMPDRTDNCVLVWSLLDSEQGPRRTLPLPKHIPPQPVDRLLFSDDSRFISACAGNTVYAWDVPNGWQAVVPIEVADRGDVISATAMTHDSKWLVAAGRNGVIKGRSLLNDTVLPISQYASAIEELHTSLDGRWLAGIGGNDLLRKAKGNPQDAVVHLFRIDRSLPSSESFELRGHRGNVNAIVFSSKGDLLVSADSAGEVRLWDLTSLNPAANEVVLRGHDGSIRHVALSPDGTSLLTAAGDGIVRLWNMDSARRNSHRLIFTHNRGPLNRAKVSADGRWLLTTALLGKRGLEFYRAGAGGPPQPSVGHMCLWDLNRSDSNPTYCISFDEPIDFLEVTPDRRWLVYGLQTRKRIEVREFSLAGFQLPAHVIQGRNDQFSTYYTCSADSRWLVVNTDGLQFWDLNGSRPERLNVELNGVAVSGVALSSDGRWLAGRSESEVTVWDLQMLLSGKIRKVCSWPCRYPKAVAFTPSSKWIVVRGGESMSHNRSPVFLGSDHPNIKFASDCVAIGQFQNVDGLLVQGGSPTNPNVQLTWLQLQPGNNSSETATPLIGQRARVLCVAMSSDGRVIVTGDQSAQAFEWDLKEDAGRRLVGHQGPIVDIILTPDQRAAVTASLDGTARIWKLGTADSDGSSVVLSGHSEQINAVTITPDGRWIVTCSSDGSARLWYARIEDLLQVTSTILAEK